MKKNNMNQGKRNIVFVGFDDKEIEKLEFQDIRDRKEMWQDIDITHRFPRLIYVDTLAQAKRHQGLLLFIKLNDENLNFVEYDIQNRKKFKNYEYVFLVVNGKSRIAYSYQAMNIAHITSKISKLAVINFHNLAYHVGINASLNSIYKTYLQNHTKTLSRTKLENIKKLNTYVKGKKYIDIKKVATELEVSTKWVERYLIDMNFLYHNVGYDEEKRQFYIVK